MKKPLGVSASAICALLGSLLMLAFCVLLGLAFFVSPATAPLPPQTRLGMGLGLAMFGVLGAWGTTTAIGLFRLRNWARVSIIVFSVLLALTGVAAAPVIWFFPQPPTAPPNYGAVRIGIAAFYGGLGLLGAFWLYYFSRRATREAFGGALSAQSGGRPLSISIIGWWLLLTGVICVLASPLRMPVSLFIWIVSGWTAMGWYAALGGLYAYVGYGLLRLNPLARKIAIGVLWFGVANAVIFFFTPGRDARFAALMGRFHFGPQLPLPTHFPIFMLIPMTLGVALPLGFLIARKSAFQDVQLGT
jgi:hypothetical protein